MYNRLMTEMIELAATQDKYGLVTLEGKTSTHTFPRTRAADGLKHLMLSSDVYDDFCRQLDETGTARICAPVPRLPNPSALTQEDDS
jgi:hypothetical protein